MHVVDTTAEAVKPEGTTRFINEYYYNQPYEYGGLGMIPFGKQTRNM